MKLYNNVEIIVGVNDVTINYVTLNSVTNDGEPVNETIEVSKCKCLGAIFEHLLSR